jgi:hypothetical protein
MGGPCLRLLLRWPLENFPPPRPATRDARFVITLVMELNTRPDLQDAFWPHQTSGIWLFPTVRFRFEAHVVRAGR